jgi:hypothetical protein
MVDRAEEDLIPDLESLAVGVDKRTVAPSVRVVVTEVEESAATTEVEVAGRDDEKATSLHNPTVSGILKRLDEPEVVKDETATGMYLRVAEELRNDAVHLRASEVAIEREGALEAARVACADAQLVIDRLDSDAESEARAAARKELVKVYCTLKDLVEDQAEREAREDQQAREREAERKRAEAEARAAAAAAARERADRRRRRLHIAMVVIVGVAPIALGLSWHFLRPAPNVSGLKPSELEASPAVESADVVGSERGPIVVGVVGQKWRFLSHSDRQREVMQLVTQVSATRRQAVAEVVLKNANGEIVARWVKGGSPKVSP